MTDLLTRSAPEDPAPPEDPVIAATRTVEELRTGFTEFRAGAEQRLAGLAALEQRLATLETRANRPAGGNPAPGEVPLERRAFTSYLRTGVERMVPDETRALIVGDDTAGGYFAPPEVSAEILKDLVEFSPIRSIARVGSIGAPSIIIPKRTSVPTARWVGEDEDRDETTMSFGQLEITTHELACFVDISQRLLEDAGVNVEGEVTSALTEQFGVIEATALMLGDGAKKPLGLLTAPGVTEVANGHATTIQPDSLIKIMHALPAQYRNAGSWLMNSTTAGIVRTLKDGNGNYLWQPSYQAGQPSILLGRPVVEALDMPDVSSNAIPIMFGDVGTAYRIYDRVGLSILRDPYSKAGKGLIRFHARRRVGAGMVMPAAVRKLKMTVS